jgi:hypothetical protein
MVSNLTGRGAAALFGNKNRYRSGTLLVILGILLLTACTEEIEPRSVEIEDKQDFIEALQDAGADLRETAAPGNFDLGVPAEVFQIDSAVIYVYEYESQEARTAISASIAVDGSGIDARPFPWPDRVNIWATGRLIVAYPGTDGGTIVFLNGLLGDPLTQPSSPVDEPFPPAVTAAVGFLAEHMDVIPGDVEVIEFIPASWPDSCLGLPDEGETCEQVATPGWKILMRLGAEEFEVHSDQIGEHMRLKRRPE